MQWEAARRWLMRACGPRGYRDWAALDGDAGEGDVDDFDAQALDVPGLDFPSWEHGADQDCVACCRATPSSPTQQLRCLTELMAHPCQTRVDRMAQPNATIGLVMCSANAVARAWPRTLGPLRWPRR